MAEHVYDSSDSCTGKSAVQEPLEYSIYGLLKKISNYNYNSGVRHGWDDRVHADQCSGNLRVFYRGVCDIFK